MAKTIITAALTGAATPKEKNPALPVTPREIAEDAVRAWKAGKKFSYDHERYATVIDGLVGLQFVDAAVESSKKDGAWVDMPKVK